jgi:hypothetical protein
MSDQLTRAERQALYLERKGKKQKRMVRVLVQSQATSVQKGTGKYAGKLLYTKRTVTAERGEQGKYALVENKPKLTFADDAAAPVSLPADEPSTLITVSDQTVKG